MSQNSTKRVRFVTESDPSVYRYAPSTSSPSSSPSGSSASSPSWSHLGAPRVDTVPLPEASPNTIQAGLPPPGHYGHYIPPHHSALYATHANPVPMLLPQSLELPAQLEWNISLPPEYATMRGVRVTPEFLQGGVTTPPTQSLTICVRVQSEQTLTVTPSIQGGPISIGDVLNGIYRFFRLPINPNVLNTMDPHILQGVQDAYRKRCENLSHNPTAFWEERRKGPKCIDMLFGTTRWAGLTVVGPGVAKLHLA